AKGRAAVFNRPIFARERSMPEANTVKLERDGKVALLILNRPHKRNAMSPRIHVDMAEHLEKLRYDPETKVIVITGAGESFCAGMDLKEFFVELKDDPAE